jgi:aminoglycoside/choline kinase family phosphotransferase
MLNPPLKLENLPPSIQSWLKNNQGVSNSFLLERLAGDASNRSYYRIRSSDRNRSVIWMKLNSTDRGIQSEEIVAASQKQAELPFINIQRHLKQCGIPVPEILFYDADSGSLLLQDLGEVLLAHRVYKASESTQRKLYRQAIDTLIQIQIKASQSPKARECYAFSLAFDEKLFLWEFHHFLEYLLEKGRNVTVTNEDRSILEEGFLKISKRLGNEPRCFVHRDYHSRNLLLEDGKLWVIDFQDALLGPYAYDLASLLRDSYVGISQELVQELVTYYLKNWVQEGGPPSEISHFSETFHLAVFQRNLKAAGRFYYIDIVKKNPDYLRSVPQALANARESLNVTEGFGSFRKVLAKLVPELA